ncbi:putative integral membrane protein [Rhizobium leguminosarum bv. trifolii WSM2297]|uniref:Putative integral membrane protein n=1 Tax=Rhizobium leguminosarum bv. trifolii WSM2297 TaxID=754762 RepID=J0W797_RHILT|nr:hypothetical protein [Rhizobium leguminosarum]EJC81053.1 putative integral membrane protein [Rhizobium leguminosarum bv. trifolii WSM2297]
MGSQGGQGNDPIAEPARVRAQLDRILSSVEFQAPDRSRRFLAYIVDETLAGRETNLKAYAIAQAVFGRDASFDAQNDPVVRIEAGRIRRALERYYLVVGRDDPIQITIPKGRYVPSFIVSRSAISSEHHSQPKDHRLHSAPAAQQKQSFAYRDLLLPIGVPLVLGLIAILSLVRPLEGLFGSSTPAVATVSSRGDELKAEIIVEPLVGTGRENGDADIAKGLTDEVIAQLTKIRSVIVKSAGPQTQITASTQPQFSLQGSLGTDGSRLHVQIRLVNRSDGTVTWTGAYDRTFQDRSILDVQEEIARQIADAISSRQ